MSFIEGFEVKEDLNNGKYYNFIVYMDKLPVVPTECIYHETATGREFHYGETADGFISFFICGMEDERHNKDYRWSSRDGVFNGLFGKKAIEVTYVVNNIAYAGHMTVARVERLLKFLPYIVDVRKEYCFGDEIAYGIRKL